jgi:polysaccharide biosynthesis protein PslH
MFHGRPRILYVTSHYPHAPTYGAQLRVLNIGRQLKKIGEVSLAVVSAGEIDRESLERTRGEFQVRHLVRLEYSGKRNLLERVRHELDPSFMKTDHTAVPSQDRGIMLSLMREYDIVWVHTIKTANAFRIYQWPNSVLDVDDVPSRVYESMMKADAGTMERLKAYRMMHIWKRRERDFRNRFHVLSVCSEQDRVYFGEMSRLCVIPNGFAPPSREPRYSPTVPARVGFIGLFHYLPNREGMEWFIKSVWPLIKRDIPDARLRLVGRGSEKDFPMMGADIDGLGYVDDPTDEIASWSATIVPIQVGGGTRIKIAEAFSRKCPVVSTPLGVFGYTVRHGEELLLAEGADDFRAACVRLITDRDLAVRISEKAWKRFLREWTWDSIGESVGRAAKLCAT